jgi:flagellar protein FlaJ
MVLQYVPLVTLGGMWLLVALGPISDRLNRAVNRIALLVFGPFARRRVGVNSQQIASLRAAHVRTTYRVYASKTFLLSSLAAFTGSILGVYAIIAVYRLLRTADEATLQSLPPQLAGFVAGGPPVLSSIELFGVFIASSATLGVVAAVGTYQLRWSLPSYRAAERSRRIEVSLERNVAFMYALSRSGMSFTEIFRILARNRDVYGETADEVAIAVKDIDLFGTDVIRAVERLGRRTPSEDLQDFAENLVSVMQSGRSVPEFLRAEYEYYAEESEANQKQFLDLLATLAEAYVTVLVAGPLFLITILVIIGLVTGGTFIFLQLIAYVVLPLATLGFVVYLDSITDPSEVGSRPDPRGLETGWFSDVPTRSEPGDETRRKNRFRHHVSKRLRPVVRTLADPLRTVLERPQTAFYLTVPVSVLYLAIDWLPRATEKLRQTITLVDSGLRIHNMALAPFDDAIVHVTLLNLGVFAAVYEVKRRRIRRIEANVPDFLDRFASTNEAGMPVVESFGRVVDSDLGPLTPELERTWADVRWSAHLETALNRFRDRIRTAAVTRVVALTTNAMSASGDIGPVLRIAAEEAKASRRLDRDRRNEMVTYLVVIYLAFFVFLTIIVALQVIFIPRIPASFATGGLAGSGALPGAQPPSGGFVSKDAYSLVFFHTALVQAVCSGIVAGQMGENSAGAGVKHAFLMLTIAYILFLVVA